MRLAACFLADKRYIIGCQVAAYSFVKNNPWFEGDIIVYLSEDVSDEDKNIFIKFYPQTVFKKVPIEKYDELFYNAPINPLLIKAFYKFEIFGEADYDKVIFIDSDIVVIGNIQEVLSWGEFTIPIDTELHDLSFVKRQRTEEYVNSGFFVIGKKYLNEQTKMDMITYYLTHDMSKVSWFNPWAGAYADQCVISSYFADKECDICSNIYNQKFFYFNDEQKNNVKLLHFLGDNKPWLGARIYDKYWREYYFELHRKEYFLQIGSDIRILERQDNSDKYIVCACAKNEDEYIEEWVKHHISIGFDKIIIADNNDNPENLQIILKNYISNGIVEILPLNGYKEFQLPVYRAVVNSKNYKWVACFDVDEFLEISPKYSNVKEMLNDCDGDCVLVNWLMFGPDGQIWKKEGRVQDRFKNPVCPICTFKENMFVKPIIKNTVGECLFSSSHEPTFNNGETYNIGGYFLTKQEPYQLSYPIRYKKAWLKHYYTKSFNEYIAKVSRGWPDGNNEKRLQNMNHYFLMDSSVESPMVKFSENIFNDGGGSWVFDILKEYDVILYLNPEKNYFSLLWHFGKSMEMVTDHTFIVEDDIDENIYLMLFEMAQKTGNRLIASANENEKIWDIFVKNNRGLNNTYYIITIR